MSARVISQTEPTETPPMPASGEPRPLPVDPASGGNRIETISLLFDPDYYLWKNPDVEVAGLDPTRHFLAVGYTEGRSPNRFFNLPWYVKNNPDVAASQANPFLHYVLYGAREGRKPRP